MANVTESLDFRQVRQKCLKHGIQLFEQILNYFVCCRSHSDCIFAQQNKNQHGSFYIITH